jgi:hypothetical protein
MGVVILTARLIEDLLKLTVDALVSANRNDNATREAFTQSFVDNARAQFPQYNVVVIHPPHSVRGAHVHQHYELGMTEGTCGYEIYFSKIGDPFGLVNEGDGGYINWGFIGYNQDGNIIWINMPEPQPKEPPEPRPPRPPRGGGE